LGKHSTLPEIYDANFDIETNGLLDTLDTMHCLVIEIIQTGEVISCTDNDNSYVSIAEGLEILTNARTVIGHNIIKFDIPAIQKLYPTFKINGKAFDTLVASRLIYSDMKERDFKQRDILKRSKDPLTKRNYTEEGINKRWPFRIVGRHSLDAWGVRLGCWKGDYSDVKGQVVKDRFMELHLAAREEGKYVKDCPPKTPKYQEIMDYVWATWDIEMQNYCEQDIVVTRKLYDKIMALDYSQEALDLEHEFAEIICMMETEGFCFNVSAAEELENTLLCRKAEIQAAMQEAFPPWVTKHPFTPKVNNKARGYEKGVAIYKEKTHVFNPTSRDDIADRLIAKYGWEPKEFGDKDKPKVDEAVLLATGYPESELLAEAFMIGKRLGMLADGKEALLKAVTTLGRIHGSVITNGAVTGRCTHSRPNVAQTPSVTKPFGKEFRMLFGAPKGMKQVGADLSGLELRCLAHYMDHWDKGAYTKELLEGDIHTANQLAAGLPTRGNAKTFIYGFLYGGGAAKIGEIVNGGAAQGKKLIEQFLEMTPAIMELRKAVERRTALFYWAKVPYKNAQGETKYSRTKIENTAYVGHLMGLDGRKLPIRSPHAALNTLLQSAGAIIAKKATVLLYHNLAKAGYVWGVDWAMMAHVHDEVQLWARPEIAEIIGQACVTAFEEAGEHFKFKCPITGEFKIGETWYDTH
jgi:DNA polymerase I-like protein with 3'-5' exonuclease and polymerase domains